MKLTPVEIQNQQFKVKFRGFDVREVDRFLDQMAEATRVMAEENQQLQAKSHRLEADLEAYKKREESFKRAMLHSQKVVEQMKQNARKSAELIVADAEVRAEKMLNRAHNRLAQLHEDIAELKRQRMQIEVRIRSILDAHTKLLELGAEQMQEMDEEDSKVKLLKHG